MDTCKKMKYSLAAVCSLWTVFGYAEGELSGFVELGTLYTDNALKQQADELSERQDDLSLGVIGSYNFNIVKTHIDYEATRTNFDKDSQENRTLWRGDSMLTIGSEEDPLDLLVSHSRRSLLTDASQAELLDNVDERNILYVRPTARLRVTSVDTISLSGVYADITYRISDERDSDRYGADLRWQHRFSEISGYEISLQQYEVEYPELDMADYTYRLAWIGYEVQGRRLSYHVQVGYNKSEPDFGQDVDGIFFDIEALYGDDGNNILLNISRTLTDTSAGNNNDDFFSNIGSGDASQGVVNDQIERTSADITWNYGLLCVRCTVALGVGIEIEDYNQSDFADNEEAFVRAGFGYQLTPNSQVDLTLRLRDQDFDDPSNEPFRRYSFRAEYRYNFVEMLSAAIFYAYDDRDADVVNLQYDESVYGVSARYTF